MLGTRDIQYAWRNAFDMHVLESSRPGDPCSTESYFTCSSTQPDTAVYHTLYLVIFGDGLTSYDYSIHVDKPY